MKVTLNLPDRVYDMLRRKVDEGEAATFAEVVRDAIKYFQRWWERE